LRLRKRRPGGAEIRRREWLSFAPEKELKWESRGKQEESRAEGVCEGGGRMKIYLRRFGLTRGVFGLVSQEEGVSAWNWKLSALIVESDP